MNKAAAALKNHDLSVNFAGSSMTSYPIASYITSFCRSCVGELMNFNQFDKDGQPAVYAVTTDGFITSVSREQLITPAGGLCQMVQDSFTARGFVVKPFIGTEASGNCGIFLKTRGYAIIDTVTLVDGLPPTPAQSLKKMAAIGVQVDRYDSADPVRDFLEKIFTGYADKSYFVKLTKIRAEQVGNPDAITERRLAQSCKIDMTYDMKHTPVNITSRSIVWAGKKYVFPSFDTVPLQSSVDFHLLRSLRRRDNGRDLRVLWPCLTDPALPQRVLVHTGDLPLPVSPAWTYLQFDTVLPEFVYEKDLIDAYFRDNVGVSVANDFCSFANIPTELIGQYIPKSPKTLDFNYTTHRVALIELLINMREIPTYMVSDDYIECMERFHEYSGGDYHRSAPVVINGGSDNTTYYTKIGDIDD